MIGLAHTAVAVATAWLVYEVGRRVVDRRVGLVAALLTTLHPYLVWHDVHMNREILDHFLAVGRGAAHARRRGARRPAAGARCSAACSG